MPVMSATQRAAGPSHVFEPAAPTEQTMDFAERYQKYDAARGNATNSIVRFLRRCIAQQCYGKMFANGKHYAHLHPEFETLSVDGPYGTIAFRRLDQISAKYMKAISEKVGVLDERESKLLDQIQKSHWHFRHQTNAHVGSKQVTLLSSKSLERKNIDSGSNTKALDKQMVHNHDFVFFGVEFSNDKSRMPVHKMHTTKDYGFSAFLFDEDDPRCEFGYMTLTDHFDNRLYPQIEREQSTFQTMNFPDLPFVRRVSGKENADAPLFSKKHMKTALGLHLIEFARQQKDETFSNFIFSGELSDDDLDRVLNLVFQSEFHVPRILSTQSFVRKHVSNPTLDNLIRASNLPLLNALPGRPAQLVALKKALMYGKSDVIMHLMDRYAFSKQEMEKAAVYDLEYVLSGCGMSLALLKRYVDLGFVSVNKRFQKVNNGETMLDNAIKYKNQNMIDYLQGMGAVCGKDTPPS